MMLRVHVSELNSDASSPVRVLQDGSHVLGGLRLHLLVERLQVHALGVPELDLRHRARVLVLGVQQLRRVLAQNLNE